MISSPASTTPLRFGSEKTNQPFDQTLAPVQVVPFMLGQTVVELLLLSASLFASIIDDEKLLICVVSRLS
jgi:hypothetical protein